MMKVASVSATAAAASGLHEAERGFRRSSLETRFIDRGFAAVDGLDESRIDVGTDDAKALAREHGREGSKLAEPHY